MNTWIGHVPIPWLRESLLLMRADRPIGTWLLLWPALWGLAAASQGRPSWSLLVIFSLGAFVMRSAGCVANDITDRDIDPLVTRTRNRPLAAGRISLGAARRLLFFLLTVALVLGLLLPPMSLALCVAGALLALTYPFAKRFIPVPQLHLGMAFAWGVPIAWVAVTQTLTLETWLLFLAALTWTMGFDTIYALMDRADDLKVGVHSTAIFFGRFDLAAIGLLYLVTVVLLWIIGQRMALNGYYDALVLTALLHGLWQLHRIRHRATEMALRAFLSNKWFGGIVFAGFILGV
ncbi:MAG: 4-hydroxybenzoate octaprenyltransferase [Magnetococcales bacterium]|nr:4-hydroxybenzoate octaprenyltransferase [Magnetococcales bacterium]NGZ04860.1 4-hydroxybenzoate octaprenyltransferase [Magnetococcales bacterium]